MAFECVVVKEEFDVNEDGETDGLSALDENEPEINNISSKVEIAVSPPNKRSRRVNRVSWRQLEILWEFLNSNRSIATAHNRSLQAKEYSRRKWQGIAEMLNSQGDGAHKDWTGWTKYWVDYKAKLKKRVAVLRASHVQTGGGPSTEKPLNQLEEKFLQILGEDIGQGLPGVRVELPPEIGAASTDVVVHDSSTSESILENMHPILDPTVPIVTQNIPSEPILEPLPQNPPLEPLVQDPPAHSPSRTPTLRHATSPVARSPRQRRRRREAPMSQEVARRALVRSTQMHAEAAVRIAEAMEKLVQSTTAIGDTAVRIESESTKASTTEVQTITSRKKTNAQRCREYRERKKLQNTMVQNITAQRSDECSETDQLQAKKPKTNAERRKKHYEAQKLKKQESKKIPKTVKQKNKEYYDRKKKIRALNTLNHHSDATKAELKDLPRSPDSSQTSNVSWLVPIKQEVVEVLPEKYLEVVVKEVPDSKDISPSTSKAGGARPQDVKIKEEVKEVLPDTTYVEITIKEEVPESQDDQTDGPACETISDDSTVPRAPTSSSEELDCEICGKRYTVYAYLQRHLQSHSASAVQCDQCSRQFLNKLRLKTHVFNRHTLLTSYPCDQCPEKLKSKYLLKEHKKTHLQKTLYQCSKCPQTFTIKCNLERHQNRNSCKKTDDPFRCKICDTVLEDEVVFKTHMKEHDDERSFECSECTMAFKHKSTLTRHMHVHTGIRPFPCPHCGKTFTSSGLLKPHLRVHTGEKPYSCKLCEKKFAHKHNMQRHMLGHEKIKHTVCDICHKGFPRESRLRYHMKTHVNEKYFLCKVCPKRFSHKQNVVRHYSRKHPGHTYQCTDTDASVAAKVWDTMKNRFCDDETEEILG